VLSGNPSAALADATRLATEYPNGLYAEEREVVAIDALCRLGRVNEATIRAQRFSVRFPGSAYQMRIARALEAAKK
jgi:hypothetical protein